MIATRYAIPVVFLLLFALVPTVIHSYLGLVQDYGVSVTKINPTLGDFSSVPAKRNSGWGKETFDSYDWVERIYEGSQGKSIRLFVAKSYDHKKLYHHPELALSYGKGLSKNGNSFINSTNIIIPVNLLKNEHHSGIAAYALLYDGEFVENPIVHAMKSAWHLLFNARKPIILFYVSDDYQSSDIPFDQTLAADVLKASIIDFIKK